MTKQEPVLKAIFLDRDGVINNVYEKDWVRSWEEFIWLPGAKEALTLIMKRGYICVVITNQSCVGRGILSREKVDEINLRMIEEVESSGGRINAVYVCPHKPDDGCACRKPKTANFEKAMKEFSLKPEEIVFIGDYESDRQAAMNVGCRFEMVGKGRSLLDIVKSL